MLKSHVLVLFLFLGLICNSQEYLLFFKDKPTEKIAMGKVDFYDLTVNKLYVNELKKDGTIVNTSKWLNGVHYRSELSQSEIEDKFSFVTSILPVFPKDIDKDFLLQTKEIHTIGDSSIYGTTFNQLELTKTVSCLHDKGFAGNGVLIAVLDAGFPRMDTMLAFRKMRQEGRIIDTWDFEDNAANVYHKSTHGSYVSSIVGAELDSTFIGSAPEAKYAFYITEIARFEKNIEEFNLVLGLERADSIGADICSISLGYRNFDTLQVSYGYPSMDGQTTIAAQGVSIAKNKGMIISVAAGNSGSGAGTLSSPCDADSILCVGALKFDSTRAGFSSEGPTFDGRIKPDLVTIGEQCYFVGLNDTVYRGNGTSFSTPLFSGLVACLKQAHPLRSNFEIIDAIKTNSDRANSPDNIYGWGIPNGCKIDSALSYLDSTLSSTPELKKELKMSIYPNPASSIVAIKSIELITDISIIGIDGKLIRNQLTRSAKTNYQLDVSGLQHGTYFLIVTSLDGRKITKKLVVN